MLKHAKIQVDAHTHTVMSGHAWSTLQENCAAAAKSGMKAICMTDHGPRMKGSGTIWAPWSFVQLPESIEGIRVYPGMEFNLWDTEGHLDDYPETAFPLFRFGIASMHRNIMPFISREAHTEAYIRAMAHDCVDLIGHPGIPAYPV
ncbi:MAG: PHP domain-containing protein [Clostridia bacterium]|nr:PHP domain-containing protein [Clostridia bacterium]